jgi:hypothetical protein
MLPLFVCENHHITIISINSSLSSPSSLFQLQGTKSFRRLIFDPRSRNTLGTLKEATLRTASKLKDTHLKHANMLKVTTAMGLLLLLTMGTISFCHAAKSSPSLDMMAMQQQQQHNRRHLQQYFFDRDDEDENDDENDDDDEGRDRQVECPTNSVYHCNEPNRYVMIDPTVACDPKTCRWNLSLLSPFRQPYICRGIVVQENMRVYDVLEPCLWWQTLYGDKDENGRNSPPPGDVQDDPQAEPREEPPTAPLPAPPPPPPPRGGDADPYEPTAAPSASLEVDVDENTEERLSNGTTTIFEPSTNSTFNNNFTNSSMEEFAVPESSNVTTSPWGDDEEYSKGDWFGASSSDADNSSTTTTLNFNTILITYFVTTNTDQDDRRVLSMNNKNDIQQWSSSSSLLRRGGGPSSSLSQTTSRHLKSVWKDVDREQLLDLTVLHLLSFIPEAKSVIITLTVLQEESETTGSIVAATEALKGSVVFDTAAMNNSSSSFLDNQNHSSFSVALDRRVKSAFQDEEALKEYMSSIQASSDPILKRTVQVTLGLPRDPSTSVSGFSRGQGVEVESGGDDETSSLTDFEWNPLWIAILVGAAIGVLGLCTVGTYLFWARRLHRRRLESGVVKATLTGSFTYGDHADDDDNNNSPHSANLGASPSGVVVLSRGGRRGFPSDNRNSGGGSGRGRPSSPQSMASSSISRRDSRLLLADITGDSEDAMLADLQSECTSVYSYIEKSTVAGAESITTMQMIAMMEDDASIVTPCPGTSSYYRQKGATTPDTADKKGTSNRMDLSSMWSVMDGLDAPAVMAIQDNTTDEESGEIEEFHDEEEEEKKSESFDEDIIAPHVTGRKKIIPASHTKLMFSAEKDKSGQNNGIYIFDDDVSMVSEKSSSSKVSQPREDPKIVDTAGRHESPSNPNASSIKVVGKAEVDSENGGTDGEDGCRLAFCDLSQVAEGSESSSRVSCSSVTSGKLDRKLSMDKENAVGKLLDDSEIESEGDEDDDSLFMRPTLGLKTTEAASPSVGQTVLLSNENKVSPGKDAFRMRGPSAMGGDKLTPQEKKHMFIMERTPGGSFDDSSLHSIRLPGNLNTPEFRDDMSLSTTGSTSGKPAKMMASF